MWGWTPGRFESAVACAERAAQLDPQSAEVAAVLGNVKSVVRARSRGNELFNSGRFTEASVAYGEGLKVDPSNPVLYCNRAACWSKLGQWEKSIEDCDEALIIHPNYTKALLRRAASNAKVSELSLRPLGCGAATASADLAILGNSATSSSGGRRPSRTTRCSGTNSPGTSRWPRRSPTPRLPLRNREEKRLPA